MKIYLYFKRVYLSIKKIFVLKKYGKPKVADSLETIDYILKSGYNVSRFGDGEFDIINGKSIKFQEYDKVLASKLQNILKNNKDNLIVCIPCIYESKNLKPLKNSSKLFWLNYLVKNHHKYVKYLDLSKQYYDASVSRPYIRYKFNNSISDELFKKVKNIWQDKDIIIVEGEYSRLGVGNDLFANAKSLKRILCPSKNAFSVYDKIIASIKKEAQGKLVLIALGPSATVMASELLDSNIYAIDLGHLDLEYEWYKIKAKERVDIENKIVNELDNKKEILELNDQKYQESIIDVIK